MKKLNPNLKLASVKRYLYSLKSSLMQISPNPTIQKTGLYTSLLTDLYIKQIFNHQENINIKDQNDNTINLLNLPNSLRIDKETQAIYKSNPVIDLHTLKELILDNHITIEDTILPSKIKYPEAYKELPKNKIILKILELINESPICYTIPETNLINILSKCAFTLSFYTVYKKEPIHLVFIEDATVFNLVNQFIKVINYDITMMNRIQNDDFLIHIIEDLNKKYKEIHLEDNPKKERSNKRYFNIDFPELSSQYY